MKAKDFARALKSFKLEIGGIKAQGPPAMLLALSGLVLAAGAAKVLAQNVGSLPETLREAKGFVESLREPSVKRLNS